jgi:hypothetical protein
LNISLSLFALDLVIGPTGISNGSFGVICIASFSLFSKGFILKHHLYQTKRDKKTSKLVLTPYLFDKSIL